MTRIVTDTTCGLPLPLLAELGIAFVPQIVTFGEQSYRDDTELDTALFLQKLKASSTLPKTAAPVPAMYGPIFDAAARAGESVIVVAPSARMSGTVRSAETAAKDFPQVDVRIVDTRTIAGSLGTLTLMAHRLAAQGASADQVVELLNDMIPRSHTYFVLDTLEYLQKGGRIGGARALLGELLQVKPILQIREGQVESCEQERTKKRALDRLVEIVCEQARDIPDTQVCVMHIDAEQEAQALRTTLCSRLHTEHIPVYLLPPAIVVHVGPRVLAVGLFA
jgi:DegV family protein with EDD domain